MRTAYLAYSDGVSSTEDNAHSHHARWLIVIVLIAAIAMVGGAMLLSP
jgi:hypothetical protein